MKYIIMCGGKYEAWETPKQLTEIRGEKIVERTIRLLRDAGVENIAISATDERFKWFGVPVLTHDNSMAVSRAGVTGSWVDAFYPMSEPACYLMGDVVFSPRAIQTIVQTDTDSIEYFASCPPFSWQYFKPYAEPFAFKVRDQKRFRAAIDFVRANVNTGIFCRHPIAWELWQVINGWDTREINFGTYTAVNDYTCDVDSAGDVRMIEEVIDT